MTNPAKRDAGGMPMQLRDAPVSQIDAEARTAEVVFSTGASVRRYDWMGGRYYDEILVVSAAAIDLSRMQAGAPLLDAHQRWSMAGQIGVIERAWIDGQEAHAVVRFPKAGIDENADRIFAMVNDRIVKNVSVGYSTDKVRVEQSGEAGGVDKRYVERWTPMEISLVPIGADAGAQVRGAPLGEAAPATLYPVEFVSRAPLPGATSETTMTTPSTPSAVAAEAAPLLPVRAADPAPSPADAEHTWFARDIAKVTERAKLFGLSTDVAVAVMGRTKTLDEATDALQDAAVKASPGRQAPTVAVTRDEGDTLRRAVESSIMLRANPQAFKPEAPEREMARNYRGMSLLEAGRSFIEETQGVKLRGLSRRELAGACLGLVETRAPGMHSTSDFANLLANVASKRLRAAYEAAPQTWRRFSRQSNSPDFKEKSVVQLSSGPSFKKVREGAEFTYGGLTDGVEKYALATYGRIIAITRQTLINDDLGAFDRLPTLLGRAAAELEATTFWSILLDNPAMADAVTLFHADHANLLSASAIDETNLALGRAALRKQKSLAAKSADREVLNLSPAFLIVGPDKEVQAQKMLTAVTPNATSGVNVFQGSMELIVEGRITGNKWFLSADPATIDTIEYAYLEGEEGVFTERRIGFEVDGIEVKGRLDFAAKAIDWRGLVYNPGA